MNKNSRITVRCTSHEKQALLLMAQQDERSPSDVTRRMIRQEAQRRGIASSLPGLEPAKGITMVEPA